MSKQEAVLIGKEIEEIEITGYKVKLITTDGYTLTYWASDAGYSMWDIERGDNE